MPTDLERWANQQVAAAVAIGVNPIDAAKAAKWVIDHLPAGADPNTYIFSAADLTEDITSPEVLQDARADWYAKTDPRYARLLDASEAE